MGYGFYFIADRPCGYGVEATCDKRGCDNEIDRGLAYLCGDTPHRPGIDDGPGCGRYYCYDHLGFVEDDGFCDHRGTKAWGRTLACMALREDASGKTYCLFRVGHEGPHAWDPLAQDETA